MEKPYSILLTVILLASCDQKKEVDRKVPNIFKNTAVVEEKTSITKQKSASYSSVQQRADSLVSYYNNARTGKEKQMYDRLFFDAFPSKFIGMQKVFGFDDEKGGSPLYSYPLGSDIIQYFSNLSTIPKEEYYQKYTSICVGGIWEADNIQSAFGFADKLLMDTQGACSALKKHSDKEIKSIFRFIFDGPHPDNESNQELYRKLLPKLTEHNEKLGELLTASYSELMQEEDEHGH